jgi:hypothetical protein
MTTTKRLSVLDLTAGQVETIEKELSLPVNRWPEAPSIVDLYCKVLSAHYGKPEAEYKALPMRELIALVSLDEDSDPNP